MLAAMPQNQAIGLGIAGGFAITTGTSSYPRKILQTDQYQNTYRKKKQRKKQTPFCFYLYINHQRQSKEPEFNYPLHLGSN